MEKRKYKRTIIDPIEVVFELVEGEDFTFENVPITIEEVSKMGAKFTSSLNLSVNESIRFSIPSIEVTGILEGKIAWKRDLGPDHFQYGLQIING